MAVRANGFTLQDEVQSPSNASYASPHVTFRLAVPVQAGGGEEGPHSRLIQASHRLRDKAVVEQLHGLEQKLTQQHEEHLQVCIIRTSLTGSTIIRAAWRPLSNASHIRSCWQTVPAEAHFSACRLQAYYWQR